MYGIVFLSLNFLNPEIWYCYAWMVNSFCAFEQETYTNIIKKHLCFPNSIILPPAFNWSRLYLANTVYLQGDGSCSAWKTTWSVYIFPKMVRVVQIIISPQKKVHDITDEFGFEQAVAKPTLLSVGLVKSWKHLTILCIWIYPTIDQLMH